jgi:hypothetical protein
MSPATGTVSSFMFGAAIVILLLFVYNRDFRKSVLICAALAKRQRSGSLWW